MANVNQAIKPFADRTDRILRNLDSTFDQINRVAVGFGRGHRPHRQGDGTVQSSSRTARSTTT